MVAACLGLGLVVLMGLADIAEPLFSLVCRQREIEKAGW
jgi:hypothetical protein